MINIIYVAVAITSCVSCAGATGAEQAVTHSLHGTLYGSVLAGAHAKTEVPRERTALLAKGIVTSSATHPLVHRAQAHSPDPEVFKVGAIVIEAPWLRATPRGAKVAGGYMRITNKGSEPDRLVGGSLETAHRFEVHEMTMVDDIMRMRRLEKGLEIKPGQTVELRPGGYHIMAMDLQRQLVEGDVIRGTLQFEKAGAVEVQYMTRPMGRGAKH